MYCSRYELLARTGAPADEHAFIGPRNALDDLEDAPQAGERPIIPLKLVRSHSCISGSSDPWPVVGVP
jgi:hypothetical protein